MNLAQLPALAKTKIFVHDVDGITQYDCLFAYGVRVTPGQNDEQPGFDWVLDVPYQKTVLTTTNYDLDTGIETEVKKELIIDPLKIKIVVGDMRSVFHLGGFYVSHLELRRNILTINF